MVKTFLRIYDFFAHRRPLFWTLLCVFTFLLVGMVASLRYNENIYDFLPLKGAEQKAITLYQDISGGQRIVAMFRIEQGDTTDTSLLTEAVDDFAEKLQTGSGRHHIREVMTQVDFDKVAGITDFIYHNLPLMLTDSDYVRMERLLSTPEYASEQLARDVQMVMMPATGFFTTSISNDPLALFSPVMERLESRQSSMPFEIDDGYIFTPGRRYALAMLTSPYGAMESAQNGELVSYVDSVARLTMEANPAVSIATTGSPVIAVGNARQIRADSQWAISIAVTLILLLLMFSFRRVKNLLLIGVAIVFGWLFAMAFMAGIRSNVSLIVLGIGSIIIGIAVNYPLHFIAHTDHGGTVREVLKDMVSPLLIGNITTVGAFASLVPLDAPALRDLGLFAAFMLVGTILFVLVFLPHLVRKRVAVTRERLLFGRLSSMTVEPRRWILWLIVVLTVVLGWFSMGTSFDANMHNVNYMTPSQERLLSELHASAGINDTSSVYLVTEGSTWDEALRSRRQMASVLDSLRSAGLISRYSDATAFVASADEQQRRISLWDAFWQRHRQEVLSLLRERAPRFGFSDDAFSGFEQILSATYEPQPFRHFEPIRDVLLGRSFSESTGLCSVVDVLDTRSADMALLEETLGNRLRENGYAFDFVGMNSAVARSLSDNFNYIGFACGCIVFLFLWISFGRLELSLLAFLPMALGWIWILGLMQVFGMKFNIVNVILATFIFGQGDDYTIFITDGLINEYAYRKRLLPSYKNSIIISALIMFIGMGSLIVARHPALHSLAEVTIVGMLTVVLMAWVVPPLIFGWLVKTDGHARHVPVTIDQIVRTGYSGAVYLFELLYGCVAGLVVKLVPGKKSEAWFHRLIHRSMQVDINNIWGVRPVVSNPHGEDFSRGSIIVSNHQSMLDPIYLLALSPRVLVMVGGRVWRNPIVNSMFRLSRFINAGQPLEQIREQLGRAIADGYNVAIFPEGRRTDNRIMRFHKGAFLLAQELGADILPVYLHGTGHVMPKGSGLATRGQVDVEVGQRIPAAQMMEDGGNAQQATHRMNRLYRDHYAQMCRRIETTHYFRHYLILKYTYRGIGVERETRRLLRRYDDFSRWIDGYKPAVESSDVVSIVNAGRGQFSLLFAWVHPELEVHSYAYDTDDVALSSSIEPLPQNLHVHHAASEQEALQMAQGTNIVNLSDLIVRTI